MLLLVLVACTCALIALGSPQLAEARVTFEKMTNRDYSGLTYYTIQNVSLFECLGWCKEEMSCTSAVFSFVVNPFAALQETTCMLQNDTQARQTAYVRQMPGGEQATIVAHPQKATNLYFFNKIELHTEAVCSRLWAFERFPNRRLRQRDGQRPFHAPTKESCQAACMNEQRFVCRSLEYNYITQQCTLNSYDRRSPLILHLAQQAAQHITAGAHHANPALGNAANYDLIEAAGSDYFENACLLGEDICNESRIYDYAKIGMPLHRIAHFVELNYYPDKEMLVKSQAGCVRACTIEHEFICRSILYRSSFKQGQPNCALYHLDQKTFPDGADTFMAHVMQPLLDSGETSAVYLEAVCNDTISPQSLAATTITMPPTSITILPSSTTPGAVSVHPSPASVSLSVSSSSPSSIERGPSSSSSSIMQLNDGNNGNSGNGRPTHISTGQHLSVHTHSHNNGAHAHLQTNHSQVGSLSGSADNERFIASTSTLSPLGTLATLASSSTTIRLPTTFLPPNGGGGGSSIPSNIQITEGPGRTPLVGMPSHITIGPPQSSTMGSNGGGGGRPGNGMPSHLVISPAPAPSRDSSVFGLDQPPPQSLIVNSGPSGITNHDQNCDAHGFCYDVALKCTDTKMVVTVKTQRPFFGRIYALGRSETCNANIKNQNQFQLDMYLTGQECNTQSAVSVLHHVHHVVSNRADARLRANNGKRQTRRRRQHPARTICNRPLPISG